MGKVKYLEYLEISKVDKMTLDMKNISNKRKATHKYSDISMNSSLSAQIKTQLS